MKVFTYIKDNSSRVFKKNFQKIGSLPLWKHLLYELRDFDIFIDTDSQEIIEECNIDKYLKAATCYKREQDFIDKENDPSIKESPALLMIDNFLNKFVSDDSEIIVLTHVTSPFLKKETILDAIKKLKDNEFVHAVSSKRDFAWLGDKYIPINFDPSVVEMTQNLKKISFSNGAFFIFTKNSFKKYKNRLGDNNFFYELSSVEAIEIDTEEDLEFARIVKRGITKHEE
jgi:CMP-N-acetylneuraminic acid synthetase